MPVSYRMLLEKIRDLKIKQDDLPELSYEDENDLIENPIIIERPHLIHVLKRLKQERLTKDELFDWIHFVWFSDYFSCSDEDADCITGIIQALEEMEEEEKISSEYIQHCLYALEHNEQVDQYL
jgi:hypothetical protein